MPIRAIAPAAALAGIVAWAVREYRRLVRATDLDREALEQPERPLGPPFILPPDDPT